MGEEASERRSGETLDGRYRLGPHLGDDGAAELYAAMDMQAGDQVLVRLLRPECALQPGVMDRFLGLAQVLLEAPHVHLPEVRAVASDDTGIPFVVEARCTGQRLDEMLDTFPEGMPLGAARVVLAPVVEALARAHVAGAVHGRLDARRVVLAGDGGAVVPRVLHYSACPAGVDADAVYVAPELRGAGGAVEPSADVWSIGVLLYRALSGQLPEDRPGRTLVALDELVPHLPAGLTGVVQACLDEAPAARLQDAGIVWMRIEAALSGAPARASRPGAAPASKVAAPVDGAAAPVDGAANAGTANAPVSAPVNALGATMIASPADVVSGTAPAARRGPVGAAAAGAGEPPADAPPADAPPADARGDAGPGATSVLKLRAPKRRSAGRPLSAPQVFGGAPATPPSAAPEVGAGAAPAAAVGAVITGGVRPPRRRAAPDSMPLVFGAPAARAAARAAAAPSVAAAAPESVAARDPFAAPDAWPEPGPEPEPEPQPISQVEVARPDATRPSGPAAPAVSPSASPSPGLSADEDWSDVMADSVPPAVAAPSDASPPAGAPEASGAADDDWSDVLASSVPPPASAPGELAGPAQGLGSGASDDDWPEVSTDMGETAVDPAPASETAAAAALDASAVVVPDGDAGEAVVGEVAEPFPTVADPGPVRSAVVRKRDGGGLVSEAAMADALAAAFGPPSGGGDAADGGEAAGGGDAADGGRPDTRDSDPDGEREGASRLRGRGGAGGKAGDGPSGGHAVRKAPVKRPNKADKPDKADSRGKVAAHGARREADEAARKAEAVAAAQVARLVALRGDREESEWRRWARLLLLLLLLLMFSVAVPMLYEPDLATARRVFGTKLRIAGIVMMASTGIALFRVWTMKVGGSAFVVKPMVFTFQGFALCIGVLLAGVLTAGDGGAAAGGAAGMGGMGGMGGGGGMLSGIGGQLARAGLPLFGALLFLTAGLWALMQGIQLMGQSLLFALALWMAAASSGVASVNALSSTVFVPLPPPVDEDGEPLDGEALAERLQEASNRSVLKRLLDRLAPPQGKLAGAEQQTGDNVVETTERKMIGGGGEDDLVPVQELEQIRRDNAKAAEELRKRLPGGGM